MLCRSMIFVVPLRLGCVQHDRQTFFYVPLNENLVVAILLILSIVAFVQVDFDDAAFFFVRGQTWAWGGWGGVEASGLGQAGGGYGLVWLYFHAQHLELKS